MGEKVCEGERGAGDDIGGDDGGPRLDSGCGEAVTWHGAKFGRKDDAAVALIRRDV